jgi:adenosylcobinamide-GDP ribazoletransferase
VRAAFSYFTILPVGSAEAPRAADLVWLPLVGAVVGALAGGFGALCARVAPHPLAVVLAYAALVALSGAIHLDGFLDGCDALFASVAPERRLEILEDPRHGTYALAGGIVLAALQLAALSALPPARLALLLALSGASARWGAVLQARWAPYGRAGASARAFESKPPLLGLALGALLVAGLAWPLGAGGALAALVALALASLCARWSARRLGGVLVGDAYGFAICVAEAGALVALACLPGRT